MIAAADVVAKKYSDGLALIGILDKHGEVSLRAVADDDLRKMLILSAASYFESEIIRAIRKLCVRMTHGSPELDLFVYKKALARQYHTLFDWESNNVNKLIGFFGDEYRTEFLKAMRATDGMDECSEAFVELGALRNRLVHMNYATFTVDKTAKEIYELFEKAKRFAEFLASRFDAIPLHCPPASPASAIPSPTS